VGEAYTSVAVPEIFAQPGECDGTLPMQRTEDRQYLLMQRAFRNTGGLATGDEVALLLRRRSAQPISQLARWIVTRLVVSIERRGQTFLPLFQFNLSDMALRCEVLQLVRELSGTLDDWDVALWFALPNPSLNGRAPVEMIGSDPAVLLNTARADRFVVWR
jgi:hypothetical protein